jgi:hypothetical protein
VTNGSLFLGHRFSATHRNLFCQTGEQQEGNNKTGGHCCGQNWSNEKTSQPALAN